MTVNDRFTRGQLLAVGFCILLSTGIRSLLGTLAETSGGAAWLAPALAVAPLSLLAVFMTVFLRGRREGEGLGELILRILGGAAGRVLVFLITLWLIFVGAFVLWSSSVRLVGMIYPDASPGVFYAVLLALCTVTSLGRVSSLARMAQVFRVTMLCAVIFVLILGSAKISPESLLPISRLDLGPVSLGVLSASGSLSVISVLPFLAGKTKAEPGAAKAAAGEISLVMALICAMTAVTVGYFGPELTRKLYCPFFMLVRDITLIRTIERIDVLVVALWLVTDFIFACAMFAISVLNLRLVFGLKKYPAAAPLAASAGAAAFFPVLSPASFAVFGALEDIITRGGSVLAFCVFPVVFLIGKMRRVI